MSHPSVAFVVPARNEADYLRATLSSIDAQRTDREYETVVADGGSTDGTREAARAPGATVGAESGDGIAAGRNAGAAAADTGTEWLAFVDADTVLAPEYLETMLPSSNRRGSSPRPRGAG